LTGAGIARPPGLRRRLRRLAMGLATLSGLAARGFFIPYRHAARLPTLPARDAYPALVPLFEHRRPAFEALLAEIDALAGPLRAIGTAPAPEPRWNQGWFPRLDAAAAYAMVRRLQPRRIVEIGSGHSTRFLARAVRDGGIETRLVAIDPEPRARLDAMAVRHFPVTAHAADAGLFEDLAANDILFIDSSHILMPGSDVDLVLNTLWPRLAAGVVMHVHDVFLPDDYPAAWRWRGYNEQLGVAPLIAGGGAEILFASHYVATRMADRLAATVINDLPLIAGALESGLWLQKRAALTMK
jgi:predicted O-methyltransferase YrrM